MTRRAPALAALGLAAYLLFLAALTPATFVAARVEAEGRGTLRVTEAQGRWWRGEARVNGNLVTWIFKPSRIFAGRIAFDVHAAAPGLAVDLEAARAIGGLQVRDLRASGDASALTALLPMLATLRPGGALTLSAPRLDWDGAQLRGAAQAEWRGATLGLSDVRPLGSFKASLEAIEGPSRVGIATIEGPLRINGQGTLAPTGAFVFTGEARADAAQAAALEPLLSAMGPRRADGAYSLEWRSR